jgi:hypothetical protein
MKKATFFFLFFAIGAAGQSGEVAVKKDTVSRLLFYLYTADQMPVPDRKELEVCNERGHYWQYLSSHTHSMLYTPPTPPQLIDETDRTILREWTDGQKERCKRCESTRYVPGEWTEKVIWSRNNMKQ